MYKSKMGKQVSWLQMIFFFTLPCILVSFSPTLYHHCSRLTYNPMTPYESNLNALFDSLVLSASVSIYNTSLGSSKHNDAAYGLFQCRGDIDFSSCRECVDDSVNQLRTLCPAALGGVIQLGNCLVKYENTNFYGIVDKTQMLKACGPSFGCNSDLIKGPLNYLLSESGYFRWGNLGTTKVLGQCIQDLSTGDCQDCLAEASKRLTKECDGSIWAGMYLGGCYVQYNDQDDDGDEYNGCDHNDGRGLIEKLFEKLKEQFDWITFSLGTLSGLTVTLTIKFTCNCCNNRNSRNVITHQQSGGIRT